MVMFLNFSRKWRTVYTHVTTHCNDQTYIGARDCPHKGGLAVSDVTNRTNVDGGLSRNDFWVQGRDLRRVEIVKRLLGQMLLRVATLLLLSDDFLLAEVDDLKGVLRRALARCV